MKRKWTAEAVRIAAGLEPFESVKLKGDSLRKGWRRKYSERAFLEMVNRQTGRTTKMVCEALAVMANGESACIVVPYENNISLISDKLYAIADMAGIYIDERYVNIKSVSGTYDHVFIDNSAISE